MGCSEHARRWQGVIMKTSSRFKSKLPEGEITEVGMCLAAARCHRRSSWEIESYWEKAAYKLAGELSGQVCWLLGEVVTDSNGRRT